LEKGVWITRSNGHETSDDGQLMYVFWCRQTGRMIAIRAVNDQMTEMTVGKVQGRCGTFEEYVARLLSHGALQHIAVRPIEDIAKGLKETMIQLL
jgi:hypothetical protein